MEPILAGMCAGMAVDTVLFPLDTIKTRLQSNRGFSAAGGFKGLFRGLLPAFVGSAPGAGLFFGVYESTKSSCSVIGAAILGESFACFVRVPTDAIKQNLQGNQGNLKKVWGIVTAKGIRSLYTGYGTTLLREIPFTCIQFPIYEYLKTKVSNESWRYALCGSVAGAFAAFVTTPLDLLRTRLLLRQSSGVISEATRIFGSEGIVGLFKGAVPRTLWIGLGGMVYFGVYEKVVFLIKNEVWGKCSHVFHMHCLVKWINNEGSKGQCPMDRSEWETATQ